MDVRWMSAAGDGGLLPEVAHRLEELGAALHRLSDDTAWESAAARAYRSSLQTILDEATLLRADVRALEVDVRSLWLSATTAGAW